MKTTIILTIFIVLFALQCSTDKNPLDSDDKNVLDLRWFISNKYPEMTPKDAAKIFADSINRIIDKHLPLLNEKAKPQIKTLLFEDAIKKPSFEITCSDVFKCCVQTKESSDNFFEELTKWTTNKSGKPISKTRLTQFVRKLHLIMNDYPYKNSEKFFLVCVYSHCYLLFSFFFTAAVYWLIFIFSRHI